MPDDSRQAGAEIEITPAMYEAGSAAYRLIDFASDDVEKYPLENLQRYEPLCAFKTPVIRL